MSKSSHGFRVSEARRFKHPVFEKVEKHYFLVRASDLPHGVRMDANARDPVGLKRQVYKEVRDSLLGDGATLGSFDLMNKGITIIADAVKRVDDHNYEVVISDGQGIVDGGHTYQLICDAQEVGIPDESYVEVQIRTGVDRDLITDISRGLNTGLQVKSHSIANLAGKFDWIKLEIEDEKYFPLIAWNESDEGDYDVRDLICILEAMNIFDFPNDSGQHPVQSYEKWSVPAEKFSRDFDANADSLSNSKYYRLGPILKDALYLYDTIRADFRSQWNKIGGNAGKLKIMEEASGNKQFTFPFSGAPAAKYRLTKGALYPIFAAFRNVVEVDPKTGRARWKDGFHEVLELWHYAAPELCRTTKTAIEDLGNQPMVIGKNRGHWANNHKTLELMIFRKLAAESNKAKKK